MKLLHQSFFLTLNKLITYKIVHPKYIQNLKFGCQKNYLLPRQFSLSALRWSDDNSSKGLQDPELQEAIKQIYKDFGVDRGKLDKEVDRGKSDKGVGSGKLDEGDDKGNSEKGVDKFVSAEKHDDADIKLGINEDQNKQNLNFSTFDIISNKHEFSSDIIYDYDEEMLLKKEGLWEETKKKKEQKQIVYTRGKTGVFDIEELVDLLRSQKALDVVVIEVPPEIKFVAYLVIATGKSPRHSYAVAEFVNKAYKKKKNDKDLFTVIEGVGSSWLALDMGNIALHIMSEEIREEKDLETLWTVGAAFDEQSSWQMENTSYSYLSLSDQLQRVTMKEE